jgi:hypothetical protein
VERAGDIGARVQRDKSGGQTNEILFEGPLLALAEKVRAMPVVERRGLRLLGF